MLKNYLKTAIRQFRKQKAISMINIAVLTIGITCTILITLFIKDELSYDRFYGNADRIYRLGYGSVGWPYGRILATEFER